MILGVDNFLGKGELVDIAYWTLGVLGRASHHQQGPHWSTHVNIVQPIHPWAANHSHPQYVFYAGENIPRGHTS